jgi:ketosteroid isomerase-like protein
MAPLLVAIMADAPALRAQTAGPGAPASSLAVIEKEVLAASTAWADALYRQDVDALERILADDYVTIQVTPTGTALVEREVQLALVRKAPASSIRAPRELTRVRVRTYGGTVAILTGVATYRTPTAGGPGQVAQAVIAEVWVKSGGSWRLSHFQPAAVGRPSRP